MINKEQLSNQPSGQNRQKKQFERVRFLLKKFMCINFPERH